MIKAKNLGIDRSFALGENLLLLLWQKGILFSSWTCHNAHRLMHSSTLIREASCCSGLDFTQGPTTAIVQRIRECGMLGPKWDIYIIPLLQIERSLWQRRNRKLRVRGGAQLQGNLVLDSVNSLQMNS